MKRGKGIQIFMYTTLCIKHIYNNKSINLRGRHNSLNSDTGKREKGNFWGHRNAAYLNYNGGYMGVYIGQTLTCELCC